MSKENLETIAGKLMRKLEQIPDEEWVDYSTSREVGYESRQQWGMISLLNNQVHVYVVFYNSKAEEIKDTNGSHYSFSEKTCPALAQVYHDLHTKKKAKDDRIENEDYEKFKQWMESS